MRLWLISKLKLGPDSDGGVLRHTIVVFGATVLVNAANFGFHFGAVRLLGLQTYSALAALMSLFLIFSVPANVLQAVITTIVGEAVGKAGGSTTVLEQRVLRFAIGGAASIAAVGLVVSWFVASYLSITDVISVQLSFVAIGLAFAVAALRGLLQGQQRFSVFGASLACEAIGNLVFGLGLITLSGSLRAAVLGNVCAILGAVVFSASALRNYRAKGPELRIDMRRAFAKSIGTMLALGTIAVMSWFDLVLVRHLTNPADSSIYGALQFVGRTILFSVAFVPLVLLAKTSKRSGERLETRSILLPMLAFGTAMCVLELIVILLAPTLVMRTIAGNAAIAAAPFVGRYATALVALALTTIVASYGIGTHRFAFVLPLMLVEVGEITAIQLHHSSVASIITVITVGHWAGFAVSALTIVWSGRAAARRRKQEDMPLASA